MAKYYSEEVMHPIRERLEAAVLKWRGVSTKRMFGCPAYLNEGRIFAFLVDGGIVLTSVKEGDLASLQLKRKVEPFRAGSRTITKWARLAVTGEEDLLELMPLIKKSYASSLGA